MPIRFLCFVLMAGLGKAAVIRVVVNNFSTTSPSLVGLSINVARRAFLEASVQTEWALGFPSAPRTTDIYVRLLPDHKADKVIRIDACGSANSAGSVVWISVGCAMRIAASEHAERLGRILGYLIAHEVGHVLLGEEGHDDSGLMRSDWGKEELMNLQGGRLRFEFPQRLQQRAQQWIADRNRALAGMNDALGQTESGVAGCAPPPKEPR